MTDAWQFWRDQLAGKSPETTPGTPHAGYFTSAHYVSLPYAKKRTLVESPVAIWCDDSEWRAVEHGLMHGITLTRADDIDELFGRVCRSAITYETYTEMVATIDQWRNA